MACLGVKLLSGVGGVVSWGVVSSVLSSRCCLGGASRAGAEWARRHDRVDGRGRRDRLTEAHPHGVFSSRVSQIGVTCTLYRSHVPTHILRVRDADGCEQPCSIVLEISCLRQPARTSLVIPIYRPAQDTSNVPMSSPSPFLPGPGPSAQRTALCPPPPSLSITTLSLHVHHPRR